MREGAEADPPGQPRNGSILLKSGGEPGHPANSSSKKPAVWERPAVLRAIIVVMTVVVIALVATLIVVKSRPPPCPPATSWCPDGWIRIQGKCYYFSKAEGNWTYSQSVCSSHGASLAGIESPQELGSLLPYKGKLDHWIGLRRDMGQVWKWVNGTEFDHRFEIRGGPDCAFLDEDLNVISSSCSSLRKWICSRPDTPVKGEEHGVGGDS